MTSRRGVCVFLSAALLATGLCASPKKDRAAAAEAARALMKADRFEDAARRWEEALPPSAPVKEQRRGLPLLGLCWERAENFPKAMTAYQRALRLDDEDLDRLLDLARVYVRVDLDREAVELYKHVLARDKNRHDARLALARLYVKTGRWDDARREGEAYAAWEPRDLSAQRLLAEVDEAQGDPVAAGNRREQILAREPSPEGNYDLGRLWVRAGRWDAADAAFARAEESGMRTGAVYLHRGVARWLKGDVPAAQAFWRKALERTPGMGAAHFFLAVVARDAGKAAEAEADSEARSAAAGAQSDYLKDLLKGFPGTKK